MKKLLLIPLFLTVSFANETATLVDIKESIYYLIKDYKSLKNKYTHLEQKIEFIDNKSLKSIKNDLNQSTSSITLKIDKLNQKILKVKQENCDELDKLKEQVSIMKIQINNIVQELKRINYKLDSLSRTIDDTNFLYIKKYIQQNKQR